MRLTRFGFSLMEMMVVLLIVAIVAAASAPVLNKKAIEKASSVTPWVWTPGNSVAFGVGEANANRTVLIGRAAPPEGVVGSKLYIETNGDIPQLALGTGTNNPHRLWATDNNGVILAQSVNNKPLANSVSIGTISNAAGAVAIGADSSAAGGNIALGVLAAANSNDSIAIGNSAAATGNNSISIGLSAGSSNDGNVPHANAVTIGANASSAPNAVSIGSNAAVNDGSVSIGMDTDSGSRAVSIGHSVRSADNSVAIGAGNDNTTPTTAGQNSVAIGYSAATIGANNVAMPNSVAIGNSARSLNSSVSIGQGVQAAEGAVAIGQGTTNAGNGAVAIGQNAVANSANNPVAIGQGTNAGNAGVSVGAGANSGKNASAIGQGAIANGENSVALGQRSRAEAKNSIAIGSGVKVTAENAVGIASDNVTVANRFVLGKQDHEVIIPSSKVSIGTLDTNNNEHEIILGDSGSTVTVPGTLKPSSLDLSGLSGRITLGNSNSTVYIPGNIVVDKHAVLGRYYREANVWAALYKQGNDDTKSIRKLRIDGHDVEAEHAYNGEVSGFSVYNSSSDRRLKNVGEVFTAGLEEIRKLELFHYTYKKDPDKTPQVGVMAQDLQKIFPTAVFKGDDGFLRIRWDEMFFALINAVKELDAKIEKIIAEHKKVAELEKDVADWKVQNAELQDEIDELKKQFKDVQKDVKKLKKKRISE